MEGNYLHKMNFWQRLHSFVENVQVNDAWSEEEKDVIINICKIEIDRNKTNNKNETSNSQMQR